MTALAAEDPADMQGSVFPIFPDRAVIVTMDGQTGGMGTAGTGELVELERIDDIIIIFLREGVA